MTTMSSGSLPPKVEITPTAEQTNAENEKNKKIIKSAQDQVNIIKYIFK